MPENNKLVSKSFEEIVVGDFSEIIRQIKEKDIEMFAQLTGDFNPLHVDKIYARDAGFKGPVAHGMLTASYISTLIGMGLPGRGALWMSQSINFHNPVFAGDTILAKASVLKKSSAARAIVLKLEISNQIGKEIISGEATVKLVENKVRRQKKMSKEDSQVILVTGGTGAIGAEICRTLGRNGHRIAINYSQSAENAALLAEDIDPSGTNILTARGEIEKPKDVARIFEEINSHFGQSPDAIIHCASIAPAFKLMHLLEWEQIASHLDVQIKGLFNCVKQGILGMLESKSGNFIVISSIAALNVPPEKQSDYVTAKAALNAFTKSIAVEYGPKGIRANIISPGMTNGGLSLHYSERAKMVAKMQTPMRELVDVSDIAEMAAFLISPAARHVTGQNIKIDSGTSML